MGKIKEITEDDAKPSAMGRLGVTDDWTITVWCDECEVWHHYAAIKVGKTYYEVWELDPHLKMAEKKKATKKDSKDGVLTYFGRFKTVDLAAEAIEEALMGDEDEDEDDDEDDDDEIE